VKATAIINEINFNISKNREKKNGEP